MAADKPQDLQGQPAAGDPGELMVWLQAEGQQAGGQEEPVFQLESEDRKKLMSLFVGHPGERVLSYSKGG